MSVAIARLVDTTVMNVPSVTSGGRALRRRVARVLVRWVAATAPVLATGQLVRTAVTRGLDPLIVALQIASPAAALQLVRTTVTAKVVPTVVTGPVLRPVVGLDPVHERTLSRREHARRDVITPSALNVPGALCRRARAAIPVPERVGHRAN